MYDYLEIGPVPYGEDCEQLGPNYDGEHARAECRAFIGQLRRTFGPEPEGARLVARSNPHDFGTYHEVAVKFDENSEAATEYAFKIEGDTPEYWDDEAKAELALWKDLRVGQTFD